MARPQLVDMPKFEHPLTGPLPVKDVRGVLAKFLGVNVDYVERVNNSYIGYLMAYVPYNSGLEIPSRFLGYDVSIIMVPMANQSKDFDRSNGYAVGDIP